MGSKPTKTTGDAVWNPSFLLTCFFVSGALVRIYEVVWLRMLGLIFGHTVYAITTVLAAFMAGLALGSFLFGPLAARTRNLISAYAWLEIGIGLYCALIPTFLKFASSLYLEIQRTLSFSYGAFSVVQFLLIFVLLLVPTTMMGGTLPVLSQALVRREVELGRTISALYAVNTLGAVAGVALAAYVRLAGWGNRATTTTAAIGNLVVGVLAIAYSWRRLGRQPNARPAPHGEPTWRPGADRPVQRVSGVEGWLLVSSLGV